MLVCVTYLIVILEPSRYLAYLLILREEQTAMYVSDSDRQVPSQSNKYVIILVRVKCTQNYEDISDHSTTRILLCGGLNNIDVTSCRQVNNVYDTSNRNYNNLFLILKTCHYFVSGS
jgi:hypothetical protein